MRDPLFISLDIGTGSVRAHALDCDGRPLAAAARPVQVRVDGAGRAEVDADHLWSLCLEVLPEAVGAVDARRIAGLGVASALGYFLLGRAGIPLGPGMLWMDRRAHAEAIRLAAALPADRWYQITGRNVDPEVFLAKLLWVRQHEPERFGRVTGFIGLKDEIIRRLTGEIGSDPTHASYSMLYDVGRREWSGEVRAALDLPTGILPRLRRATDIAGYVRPDVARRSGLVAGTPVVTCASDGTVGCIAAGVAAPGTAVNVTGTSDVLMTAVDRPVTDPERRTLLNPHPVSSGWMVGGILGTTGATLKWFMEQVGGMTGSREDFAALEALAERAGPGARGLVCLTGLTGERAPLWNPLARGVLFGLDLTHGRGEIARAVMDGVALSVRGVVEVLRAIGAAPSRIRVVGGGSSSALWNQIRADATGLPVERPRLTEGTAIGTLLLTGLGVGLFRDLGEAARRVAPAEHVYTPNPEPQAVYDRLAAVRERVYAGACSAFEALGQFRQ